MLVTHTCNDPSDSVGRANKHWLRLKLDTHMCGVTQSL